MTNKEALIQIESVQFIVEINIASGLQVFLRAMDGTECIQTLLNSEDNVAEDILHRVRYLCALRIDLAFEHPADTVLAAYYWVIRKRYPEFKETIAQEIEKCKNCWWARLVC